MDVSVSIAKTAKRSIGQLLDLKKTSLSITLIKKTHSLTSQPHT